MTSLGFEHIDDFTIPQTDIDTYGKICDRFNDPLTSKYSDYALWMKNTLKYNKQTIGNSGSYKFIDGGEKYDLILVDMYVEDNIPEKFTTPAFYDMTKKLLEKDGVTVFNRLYYGEKRKQSDKAHKDLKRIYPEIATVFPEANIMFICQ